MLWQITRRQALQQSVAVLATSCLASIGRGAAIDRTPISWPMYHGPFGNSSVPASASILGDLSRARVVWNSHENNLPVGKLRSYGNPYSRPSGGMSGLIVANRTVFFAYFRPSGSVLAENWQRRGVREDRLIAADDVVLAIDAATGRTCWQVVMADKGVNCAPSKRGGWAVTPAYHDGRVYSLGTTGRLYALDAASGKLLWERNIGRFHEQVEAMKKEALAQRRMPNWPTMRCSLSVAGGVLIVPNYLGSRDIGLVAFHRDGTKLWELPAATYNMAAPAVWHHNDSEYLLAGTQAGQLRLIEPRSGKVLWQVNGLGPQQENLAPSATHVIVNVHPGEDRDPKLYGAYRLTPNGAERAWSFADRPEFYASQGGDGGAYRRVSSLGEHWVIHRIYSPQQGERSVNLWLVQADGKIVQNITEGISAWPMYFHAIGNDRLLCVHDASHANPSFSMYALQNGRLRHLGDAWQPTGPDEGTSGYEVPMPYPILDGRLYLRTSMGVLRCYDVSA